MTGKLKSTTRHGTGNQRTILTTLRHGPKNLEKQQIRMQGSKSLKEKVTGPPKKNEVDKWKSKAGKENTGLKSEDVEASDVRLKAERERKKRNAEWEAYIESYMQLSFLAYWEVCPLVSKGKLLLAASSPGMELYRECYTVNTVPCFPRLWDRCCVGMENCYTCKSSTQVRIEAD